MVSLVVLVVLRRLPASPPQKRLAVAEQVDVHDIRVVDQHQDQLVVDVRGRDEEQMDEEEAQQVLLHDRGQRGRRAAREGAGPVELLQQPFFFEEAIV